MIILDVHIPPSLAKWIIENFHVECNSARYLKLQQAEDKDIFMIARSKNAIVITKDEDFVSLLMRSSQNNLADVWKHFENQITGNFKIKSDSSIRAPSINRLNRNYRTLMLVLARYIKIA